MSRTNNNENEPNLLSYNELRRELRAISQSSYRQFAQSLVPGSAPMLGVRLPELQRLASRLARRDWRTLLDRVVTKDLAEFYEETLLRGFLIATAPMDPAERLERMDGFVDEIHDWATCDAFSVRLKFVRKIPEQTLRFFDRHHYLVDPRPFARRFGLVMLLNHGLRTLEPDVILAKLRHVRYRDRGEKKSPVGTKRNDNRRDEHRGEIRREARGEIRREARGEIRDGEYYVRMALAWVLSMAFVQWPERIELELANGTFSPEIQTLTIRKILESRQVSSEVKKRLRATKYRPFNSF